MNITINPWYSRQQIYDIYLHTIGLFTVDLSAKLDIPDKVPQNHKLTAVRLPAGPPGVGLKNKWH